MHLEDQVTSLELSKKLLTIGVKQNSLFYWDCFSEYYGHTSSNQNKVTYGKNVYIPNTHEFYSAFTGDELLNILPQYIDTKNNEPFNGFIFNMRMVSIFIGEELTRVYSINYHCDTIQLETESPFFANKLFRKNIYDANFSNALAKTIIYLVENKLMEISK